MLSQILDKNTKNTDRKLLNFPNLFRFTTQSALQTYFLCVSNRNTATNIIEVDDITRLQPPQGLAARKVPPIPFYLLHSDVSHQNTIRSKGK